MFISLLWALLWLDLIPAVVNVEIVLMQKGTMSFISMKGISALAMMILPIQFGVFPASSNKGMNLLKSDL